MATLLNRCFYHSTLSQYKKNGLQNTECRNTICKDKRSDEWGWGGGQKLIIHNTGGDADVDGDNIVGMEWGWEQW